MSSEARVSWVRGIPRAVWLVAAAAALLHMAPFWHAQLSTPPGYEFTGNLAVSPDYMQYRVWERQSLREGPFVSNTFTEQPNARHLPVFYYWAIGHSAKLLGVAPEFVYAYSGAAFAVVLVLLIWWFVRRFQGENKVGWWVFLAIVFGGGLGVYIKVLAQVPWLNSLAPVQRLLLEPAAEWPLFEDYRSHYVYKTLYDSHFLLLWIVALLAIRALFLALERPTSRRLAATTAWFVAMTLLHVYEGITLLAIVAAVILLSWKYKEERSAAIKALVWSTVGVAAVYLVLGYLYSRSGLPVPAWRAVTILVSIVAIAFPIAWWLIAIGLRDYWLAAGREERFLIAWGAACLVLTLSGPFYPYPDRGTLTIPVPVLLIAGAIFVARFGTPNRLALAIALLVFAPGPAFQVARTWYFSGPRPEAPFIHLSSDHRVVLDSLEVGATVEDVLLAEPNELLWLAPEFPGRFYVGHFFLTPDFDTKSAELDRALDSPLLLRDLLARSGARWLFAGANRNVSLISELDGIEPRVSNAAGTLFRVVNVQPEGAR